MSCEPPVNGQMKPTRTALAAPGATPCAHAALDRSAPIETAIPNDPNDPNERSQRCIDALLEVRRRSIRPTPCALPPRSNCPQRKREISDAPGWPARCGRTTTDTFTYEQCDPSSRGARSALCIGALW